MKSQSGFHSLICPTRTGDRRAVLQPLDPTLQKFNSEYHYLFSLVCAGSQAGTADTASTYHMPNVARRLLEAFLTFERPGNGSLYDRLMESTYNREKLRRIWRFVNEYSHSRTFDTTADQDMSLLAETPAVLADLIAYMKHEAPKHVAGMLATIAPAGAE
jgi:wobble nucleotide-excising tRNase